MTEAEQLAREKNGADGRGRKGAECPNVLRSVREKLGLSLRDVAGRMGGLSHVTLADIELGLIDPKLSHARRIARFFGKTLDELWPEPNGGK